MPQHICQSCRKPIPEDEFSPNRPYDCNTCWWELTPEERRAHLIQIRTAVAFEKLQQDAQVFFLDGRIWMDDMKKHIKGESE